MRTEEQDSDISRDGQNGADVPSERHEDAGPSRKKGGGKPPAIAPFQDAPIPRIPVKSLTTKSGFEHALRVGQFLSKSRFIPDLYRDNVVDCTLAMILAGQLGVHPLVYMHEVSPVKGKPCATGKFITALINQSGLLKDRLSFEWRGTGESFGCRAYGTLKKTGEVLHGTWITMEMVKGEGWISNSKWRTMPEQMFKYRAAAFFGRAFMPEVLLGLMMHDEVVDVDGQEVVKPSGAENLRKMLEERNDG